MDTLTTFCLALLGLCAAGIIVSSGFGAREAFGLLRARRAWTHSMRDVMFEVAEAAGEFAARPPRAHRHNAHCPTCGRFARVTSEGDWGVRTVCTVHGRRLRAIRRIGRPEQTLIPVTVFRDVLEPPPITSPLILELPARRLDWLDAVA